MKKIFTFDKTAAWPCAGAAIGATQLVLMDKYADTTGPIPFIGDFLPAPWNKWSTTGNMIFGGIAVFASIFTKALNKSLRVKKTVQTYGAVTFVGGLVSGLVQMMMVPPVPLRTRIPLRAPGLTRMPTPGLTIAPMTPTGIPVTTILS